MSKGTEEKIFYFEKKGSHNTDRTLDIALSCCRERGISKIVVASSSGKTALRLHEKAENSVKIIAVTIGAGSKYAEDVKKFDQNRERLEKKGIRIVRGLHALSATERAFENRYRTPFIPLNIVADTLRMFSQGMKVCVEVSIMAAESGFVTPDEEVVAVGGTANGSDTAVVLKPAFAASFLDTKIKAILCMPL